MLGALMRPLAVEKNLEAFLSLDLPGTKVVIGAGPQEAALRQQFPDAKFLGMLENGKLSGHLAAVATHEPSPLPIRQATEMWQVGQDPPAPKRLAGFDRTQSANADRCAGSHAAGCRTAR